MALSWCKVASNLDSHPKIRRAGRLGREVFLFALRRNAEPGNPVPGRLPKAQLESWYIADQLQMPESEAVTGVTAAVTAGLLTEDGESYLIAGFDPSWGKRPMDGSERTAKWRKKKGCDDRVTDQASHNVTESHGDACDVREEKRREENSKGEGGADAPPDPIALRASKIPDRAWRAADYLRQQILADAPKAAVSRKPWSETEKTGLRLEWADTIRLIVERDNRSYEHIAAVIKFVFQRQTGKYKFIVQSAEALREKLDNIEAVMKANSPAQRPVTAASKQETITLDFGDGEREVKVAG